MIKATDYIQLKAFARQDGLLVGALWIATLACFIASIESPEFQFGFMMGIFSTPLMVYQRLKRFRDKVLDGVISYRRAVTFVMFTLGYASLLATAAAYVYLEFMDNGALLNAMHTSINTPEVVKSFNDMGISKKMLNEQLAVLQQTRSIDLAFNLLWNCITSGFFLALILGMIGKRTAKVKKNSIHNRQ